ncbi:MAG: glutamate 5-kinase [Oligoflexia bacterium]|nr:glutamate 5-kinase [Oligoflexia bacterium]
MRRWVIKAGSQIVCDGGPVLLRSWMQQLLTLRRQHQIEVIWVTSGAIASAVERTEFSKTRADWSLFEKQALSAIGQPMLMDLYNIALNATGLVGAQVLLTYKDLSDPKRRLNFKHTVEQLMKWKVVPIINENDAVATDEIKFGDNDSLSAKVAAVTGAERLIILTDVEGLYDMDPMKYKNAKLIETLNSVSSKLLKEVGLSSKSSRGTGGMFSKLKAAKEAGSKGITTQLIKGDLQAGLTRIAQGENVGTVISRSK